MPTPSSPQLVVAFDLDMTLIATVPGFIATLEVLALELGVELPAAALSSRLGPPLHQLLADHLEEAAVAPAVDRFRALYPDLAVAPVPVLPGAVEALAAVRRHGGRVLVVTGKFTPNARLHLDHLGLEVDHLEGKVWGVGKAEPLQAHGAAVLVGDHVHDVEGALAAGVTSVSVLTGGSTREELVAAGTHVVLDDLRDFPAWLDEHVLDVRLAALEERLRELGSVVVAFSGGADSALLLAAAVRVLGPEHVVAATGYSDSLPSVERDPARAFAESLGVRLRTPRTHEMEREGYRANDGQRCYFCKAELIETLLPLAAEHGIAHVATGTNADDAVAGFRPGIRAAAERGAVTPLLDAGLTKEQVRAASRRWGLPTWDKPAAACLSSRVAYGLEVTPRRLARVERAEAALRAVLADKGLESRDLRVRDLGERASVEVDRDLLAGPLAPGAAAEAAVLRAVREAGFGDAVLDPRGFRSGSLNEALVRE
ncbi:ATP-dependent sacrificial sulfur transferase LarE [Nocardioides gansuensis]|uniref:ATP-dependent sacrificial sulfur transferase LarE n=1 Tax=Nocardioides gansuensis TaxID=2138300 RepID=A0A2T8FFY1_9ACTN|nr:ATP-dependent sacrificial sulfur transferase LarE [Nocardioides gansuensis]PVG84631.1 ATP-dependent sacrificial sulfur transferase LarE [Nocardioides gansuensis]